VADKCKSGSSPQYVVLGNTDASGHLTINGTETDADIGDWTEIVYVGGVHASPALAYSVSPQGTEPSYLAVLGVSVVAYLDESHLSTYSATETNYQLAAYYDSHVESYLYSDGNQIASGSADSGFGQTIASGFLNEPASVGSHYQLLTNHYLIAPQIVYAGSIYYYNPYGFGYLDDGSTDDQTIYDPIGGAVYLTSAYLFLGTTGIDTYTPSYYLNSDEMKEVVTSWNYDSTSGQYSLKVTGIGLGSLVDAGFIDATTLEELETFPCPFPSLPCLVVNGAKVV